jgi:hypothetical protein
MLFYKRYGNEKGDANYKWHKQNRQPTQKTQTKLL